MFVVWSGVLLWEISDIVNDSSLKINGRIFDLPKFEKLLNWTVSC